MTPTSVGLVLVEGRDADGATMDRGAFDVRHGAIQTSEQAAEAVRETAALASARGLRLHAIGVTWSEDSEADASLLMRSLSEAGYDNVVAVRMPEATEALARGVASVIGYETTAVCVIEPDTAMTLVVHGGHGAVQTAFNHAIHSDQELISWVSTVFAGADWRPEALVVVGSAGGFAAILPDLELALAVPVFAPEEAELALARGAALASTQSIAGPLDLNGGFEAFGAFGAHSGHRRTTAGRLAAVAPAAMLVAGAVTFVVSVSLAVSLQLSPRTDSGPSDPVNVAASAPQARVKAPEARVNAPEVAAAGRAKPPQAPPPEPPAAPPPLPEAPAVVEAPPVDIAPPEAPYLPEAPVVDEIPAAAPEYPPVVAPPPVIAPVPAMPPPVVAPYPTKKPGILTRIRDKLRIGDDNPPPPPAAPPVVTVYLGG